MRIVKPGALEVVQGNARQARERQGVEGKLLDGLDLFRARLVVENVDEPVADLHDVDMAGDHLAPRKRDGHLPALLAERGAVPSRQDDRHLGGNVLELGPVGLEALARTSNTASA